jgi:DNA-binding Lrp family transcriptional regulator
MGRTTKTRRQKKPRAILDEKDEAIVHCIEQNPDILLKNIPDELDEEIPYATVQRRVKKLTERKVIGHAFSIDWAVAGYMVRYRVGILIDPVALRDESSPEKQYDSQKGLADYIMNKLVQDDRFKNKLVVDDVFILLGGNVDLAIDFYARDDKTATQFIIDALRRLPGISNTASAKLAYSSKHGWLSTNGESN